LLTSLLIQLCDQSDSFCKVLLQLFSTHRDGVQQPSDAALVQSLKKLITTAGTVPFILLSTLSMNAPTALDCNHHEKKSRSLWRTSFSCTIQIFACVSRVASKLTFEHPSNNGHPSLPAYPSMTKLDKRRIS
jgi:hypothetical protein